MLVIFMFIMINVDILMKIESWCCMIGVVWVDKGIINVVVGLDILG